MAKFRQIVTVQEWMRDSGYNYKETLIDDIVDVNDPADADPAYWWEDYCNGQRASCDDMVVTVDLYGEKEDPADELPMYTWTAWESEIFNG